jgi:hypothetical protein
MVTAAMVTAAMVTAAMVTAAMVTPMVTAAMVTSMVTGAAVPSMVPSTMMTAVMTAMVSVVMAAVVTAMVSVVMAAVVMPAMPALTAAPACAVVEFVADDVPTGAVPAVVVPTVGITVQLVFVVGTARGHELRIDLRQRPAGIRRLRLALHDRPEAVHNNSVPGIGTAVHKSRLLASGFDLIARVGPGRLRGGRQGKHHQAGEPEQVRRKVASGRHAATWHGSGSFAVHDLLPMRKGLYAERVLWCSA